ncbi:GTPase [Isosphaeraceae bacterium EP7]
MNPSEQDAGSRACVLTADGRGALAVVRVWGNGAVDAVDSAFRPDRARALTRTDPGRPRLGRIGRGLGDEVVVSIVPGAACEVEIHTHGGPAALSLVLDALVDSGVALAAPSDWLVSRQASPLAVQAELDLAAASTARAAEILMDQVDGALDREIRLIIDLVSHDPVAAAHHLARLIERAEVGTRLITGWRVALAGRPNVGKSRLLNALAGYDRSIVDPTPGTTRDVVTAATSLVGWPVELADTAGLRLTGDAIEAAGVVAARSWHARADLVVVVLDRSFPRDDCEPEVPGSLIVANKSDLPAAWDEGQVDALAVSAATGEGLPALIEAIAARLTMNAPGARDAVPFRVEHVDALRRASIHLSEGNQAAAIETLDGLMAGTPTGPVALQ